MSPVYKRELSILYQGLKLLMDCLNIVHVYECAVKYLILVYICLLNKMTPLLVNFFFYI